MDYRLGLMCGIDLPIPEMALVVHQPKIKEIAFIGETEFFTGAQCLCINKNILMDDSIPENTNNFQIFMMIMADKETTDKKQAVLQTLTLLFPNAKVLFTPRAMIIQQDGQDSVLVDEENFEFLQKLLEKIFCFDSKKIKKNLTIPQMLK